MVQRKLISKGIFLLFALHSMLSVTSQVSLQTGSATFSIPMFNWQDDKSRLTSTVALSYTSGNGLKVNDVASNEGQGWNLIQGGVISRLQVGEPDDQQAFLGTLSHNGLELDQDISKYPAGFLYAPVSPANGCPNALTKYPIYRGANQLYTQHNKTAGDRQLDYFAFQFNGKAGIFIVDTANGGTGRSLGDNKLKITFQTDVTLIQQGIRTAITSFIIQDVDGLIYKFAQHGLTRVLHEDFYDVNLTKPMTQPKFSGNKVYHQAGFVNTQLANTLIIGSWYLSEVDDPLTQRKITFNYISQSVNNTAGADITYNQNGNYSIISHKTSSTTTPEISSIIYPDGHKVNFTYSTTPRVDLNGEFALSAVDITYTPPGGTLRPLSEYQLNTTYFLLNRYGTPVTPYQNSVARLCLRSVRKIGVDLKEDSPPYIFDYYLGGSSADDYVPPPFCFAKDIWGYYNGNNSVDYNGNIINLSTPVSQLTNVMTEGLCFLRSGATAPVINPKTGFAKNGLLKQIIYPTGGTLTYQYTQNSGSLNGTAGVIAAVGGVHVTQTSSTDGGYSNGCSNPVVTQYNYVVNGAGSAPSLWGLEMPVNVVTTGNSYASEQLKWHWAFTCPIFGCCYWKYAYPGIMSELQAISLTDFQQIMQTIAPVLGIVTVITDIMDVATVIGGDTGFFAIAAVVVDVIGALLSLGLTCSASNNAKSETYQVYYNLDLNGASPLPTQFNRVEIVEGSGTMGKTVQQFTDSSDYAIWLPGGTNKDFSSKQRFAPWAYGLPKLSTVYDANGNIIRQTKNSYDFSNAREQFYWGTFVLNKLTGGGYTGPAITCCECGIINSYSQNNKDWTNPALYNANYLLSSNTDMTVDLYGLYSGRVNLNSVYERTFRTTDASQYVEKVTTYQYNSFNYQANYISTIQSNGEYDYKTITYPDTYVQSYSGTANVQINALYNNNLLNEPIAISTVMGNVYANEDVTVYATLANGNIKPGSMLQQRYAQPTQNVHAYSPDDNTYAANYHTTQVFTYDATSNLTGLQDEGGRVVANIYDYNDKYIVASVINANPALDKPAYTSFETSALGGWYLRDTNSVSSYTSNAITGVRSLMLSSAVLSAHLNTSKAYIVSFWATSGMSVAGGSLTKSAPTINGFTYYEYVISQGTDVVTISGNANIDELRLFPKMARMRTTTYDPLIGKTSECDENNRITYYEYDNLGRLRFVKDENHYALKMYEYNNVSLAKQNGCPGTYSNNLVTELFTRSNCQAGYQGGTASYSVPAGRYTSAISQQAADQQAEVDLLINGPANANTNGSCSLIYYNVAQSQTDSTQSCADGYKGGLVTYTVPANRYSSLVSQAAADQMAADEIYANAQAYANSPAQQICTIDTNPDWEYATGDPTQCQIGHLYQQVTDVNPNSSTYNHTQYVDMGVSTSCPAVSIYAQLTYDNQIQLPDGSATADIVVRFYYDAARTQHAVVTNLAVNYSIYRDCPHISTTNLSATANGVSSIVLYSSYQIQGPTPTCSPTQICPLCVVNFNLTAGNYTIQ